MKSITKKINYKKQKVVNTKDFKEKKRRLLVKTEQSQDLTKSIDDFIFPKDEFKNEQFCDSADSNIRFSPLTLIGIENKKNLFYSQAPQNDIKSSLWLLLEQGGVKLYMDVLEEYIFKKNFEINNIENFICKYKKKLVMSLLNKRDENAFNFNANNNKTLKKVLKYESNLLNYKSMKKENATKKDHNFLFQTKQEEKGKKVKYNLSRHLLNVWKEERILKTDFKESSLEDKKVFWFFLQSQFSLPKKHGKLVNSNLEPCKSVLKLKIKKTNFKEFYCTFIIKFINFIWKSKVKTSDQLSIIETRVEHILSNASKLKISQKVKIKLKHVLVKSFFEMKKSLLYKNYDFLDLVLKVLQCTPEIKENFSKFRSKYLKSNKFGEEYKSILFDSFKKKIFDLVSEKKKEFLLKKSLCLSKKDAKYLKNLNVPLCISNLVTIFHRMEKFILI